MKVSIKVLTAVCSLLLVVVADCACPLSTVIFWMSTITNKIPLIRQRTTAAPEISGYITIIYTLIKIV
jgi:hypothetical protein